MMLGAIGAARGCAQPLRFAEAFTGGDALGDEGRELLMAKLESRGDEGHHDPLSRAELGDVTEPKRRQELRGFFESALGLGWDRRSLNQSALGDLFPPARLVPDGCLGPRSLDQRVRARLGRAGYPRWSDLLGITVAQLVKVPDLGPAGSVAVLGACIERSLMGLAPGAEDNDGSDLAGLLWRERRSPEQPVLEALLESAVSAATSPPLASPGARAESLDGHDQIAHAARQILAGAAPWALMPGAALGQLMSGITDDLDRAIFVRTELAREGAPSLVELAAELDITSSRVAQRRERAAAQLREELAAAPAPLGWLVQRVGRSLGRVATRRTAEDELARHGLGPVAPDGVASEPAALGGTTSEPAALDGASSEAAALDRASSEAAALVLWLAGPFEPVARCPGWIGVRPNEVVARTKELLSEDGGVVSLAAISGALRALGVNDGAVTPWLEACGGVVVDDDVAVSLSGPLVDVLERLIDAHGRALRADECHELLGRAGRRVAQGEVERALRGRRFRRGANDAHELSSWPTGPVTKVAKRASERSEKAGSYRQPARGLVARVPASQAELTSRAQLVAPRADFGEQLGLPGMVVLSPERPGAGLSHLETVVAEAQGIAPGRAWLAVTVDSDLMRGADSSVPEDLVRALDIGFQHRRTFSSRFGPVMLANDGPEPSRGPLRPVAMGVGARLGDVLLLGFALEGDVVVELQPAPSQGDAASFVASGHEPRTASSALELSTAHEENHDD